MDAASQVHRIHVLSSLIDHRSSEQRTSTFVFPQEPPTSRGEGDQSAAKAAAQESAAICAAISP